MHERSLLGPADVDDTTLTTIVAALLGAEPAAVSVQSSTVEEFAYDLPAITTAGRYVVRGDATVDGTPATYAVFVKVVQSWARSPMFAFVPDELKDLAEASVPWRTEPLAYRSDLGDRLPDGLAMPRALAVFDLDEKSASVWLEMVPVVDRAWDEARYDRAAYLLGRLAGSRRVAELATVGEHSFTMADYAFGRLQTQVIPMLHDDATWQHPLVAATFGDGLRDRLRAAADQVPAYLEEVLALPHTAAHGDACPNNLLATRDSPDFTLIDYGFWLPMPVGADLSQLLIGDVQIGKARAGDLAARDDAHVAAYVRGLRDEGCPIPEPAVRRAHALHMLMMSGLSALPVELLDRPPSAALEAQVADRAAIATFCLDRVATTAVR
jgi:phosphotransferase family enzyme